MKFKKIMSVIIAFAMIMTTMVVPAFAAEGEGSAKIGDKGYETLEEAIADAKADDVIEILEGELDFADTQFVIDKAITIKGAGKDKTVLNFDSAKSAFVISSGNVTFEDMKITQGTQSNSFHISIDKGAWDAPKVQYSDVTIKNVDFVGGNYALCLIGENVVVDSSTFTNQSSHNILVYSLKGNSKIVNNTFNASTGSNKAAILWEGGADNATDLSGFIGGGTLTIDNNTANAKGVFFQFTSWKLVKALNVAITNNKVDAFTNKAIALYDMDGAVTAAGDEFDSFIVSENVFTNVPDGRTIIKKYTGDFTVDASENYLGSATPAYEALLVGEGVTIDSYYADEAKTNLIEIERAVAKIGNTEYTSLEAAIAAAGPDDIITLINNVKLSNTITIEKSVTIDGNNYKLIPKNGKVYDSAIMAGNSGWSDAHGESIKITNLEMSGFNTKYGVVRAQGVDLEMDGCVMNNNSVSNASYAVVSLNYTDAVITDSTFTNNLDRVIDVNYDGDASNAHVEINGCSFEGNETDGAGIVMRSKGTVAVKNSTFTNNIVNTTGNGATVYVGFGAGNEVSGCSFEGNSVTTSHATTKRFASAIFCDGCVVKENVFGSNTATRNGEDISDIVAVGAYYGEASVSGNYWNGNAPLYTVEYDRYEVEMLDYYKTYDPVTGALSDKADMVAKVGKINYATLQAAIDAAQAGDVVTLLKDLTIESDLSDAAKGYFNIASDDKITIDLGGKTINVTDNSNGNFIVFYNYGDLTIKNGTVNLTAANDRSWNAQSTIILNRGGNLTIDSGVYAHKGGTAMAITVDDSANSFGDAYLTVNGGEITSTYTAVRMRMADPSLNGNPGNGLVYMTVNGGTIKGDNRGIWGQITNASAEALGELNVTGGTIEGGKQAINMTSDSCENISVTILGDTVINGVVTGDTADYAISGGTFTTNVSDYCAEGYAVAVDAFGYKVVAANKVVEEVSVKYRDVTPEGEREAKVYEIVLEAEEGKEINQFASADLTFEIALAPYEADKPMTKVIKAANGMTITQPDETKDRYMFNCDGVTKKEVTSNEVVLGTITISGFGKYSILTVDAGTNEVHATTLYDNLVESFVANGDTDASDKTAKLVINKNQEADGEAGDELYGKIDGEELEVPTQNLTVEILFPNEVNTLNNAAYQNMSVSFVGGKVNKTVDLGNVTSEDDTVKFPATIQTDGKYVVSVDLPYYTTYTVEVTGAGYRTARYSVVIREDDKKLTFWNNVMDDEHKMSVEEGVSAPVTKTFLAGDIVADNNINIYDLSAVVSYFGELDLADDATKVGYAKYDLNRDGKIDSKDVAYVLVSWGE